MLGALVRRAALVSLVLLLVAAASVFMSGCEEGTDETSEQTATTEVEPSDETSEPLPAEDGSAEPTITPPTPQYVKLYFARGDVLGVARRQIPATKAVATAAMRELLLGTTALEGEYDLHTEIPVGTELIKVSITNRVATVDLSTDLESEAGVASMEMRLAQIVFTLTQFSTVDTVEFRVAGIPADTFECGSATVTAPRSRADCADVLPWVLLESPAPGEEITSPLRLTGMANVFEGTFLVVIDDPVGKRIVDTHTMGSAMGEWMPFAVDVPFTSERTGVGTLAIEIESAIDESRSTIVEIPVKMTRE